MIRPYLRDFINRHKPTTELTDETNNSDDECGKWKIQLLMQNNCIFTKFFEDTCTAYSASKPVEIFIGADTDDAIAEFLILFYKDFSKQ